MKITNLLTNRLINPIGYSMEDAPRLSWEVEAAKGTKQAAARVEVSLSDAFDALAYDTGFADLNSIGTPLPLPLAPRTRYHWRVTVRSDAGEEAVSPPAYFETPKLDEPWAAKWISPDFDASLHPALYADFPLGKPIASARAYVCGLGVYELFLNEQKLGPDCLAPGLVAYDKWLPYQTFDITDALAKDNRLEIQLGNGWYKGRYGLNRSIDFTYGTEFAAICEIRIRYTDGSEDVLGSDESWKARRTAVMDSSIFDGETRDDTLKDGQEYPVKHAGIDMALLQPRRSPPIVEKLRIRPIEILHTPAGETVLDMGQNMVGWLEFACRAPKGEEVLLQFGEVLQEGNFYRDNLRTAKCEYHYISDGQEKVVRPQFTFYGFRYVKLTKWQQDVRLEDFEGIVLYSDIPQTGWIETSNEKVNQLFQNTLWGQRGNFLDVPTDCPQRDERMGWTGDAQVFFGTAAFNMDVYAFYSKYYYDLMQEQRALNGDVPVVIPKHDVGQTGACAWGDAATIIPWGLYVRYGDKAMLAREYPGMKAWVDRIRRRDAATGSRRLWLGEFHYGDWLALDNEDPIGNRFGGTERGYLASCFYRYSSLLVSKAARVLGYAQDAAEYEALSEEVRQAILNEYATPTGRLAITTQTAYVLALYMDILPQEHRELAARQLCLKLKDSGFHLRTGFIGTPYLCRILSETGGNDIAYRLLLQEDFPSWLYQINMGATTIWERWNSILPDGSISDTGMNSLNHYSYGSIVEWLYRNAAGIQPLEEGPGFCTFRFQPQPDHRLGFVRAKFHSPAGTIQTEWRIHGDELAITLTVPFGATAELCLPDCPAGVNPPDTVGAGTHTFRYTPTKPLQPVFDLDTPVSELLANATAQAALDSALPKVTGMMLFPMLAGDKSLRELMREGFFTLSDEEEQSLLAALAAAQKEE